MNILISGANGFVGQTLWEVLHERGYAVCATVRVAKNNIQIPVGEINGDTDWALALRDVDTVIHLAARVHVMQDKSVNPLAEFRRVNVQGTENLARQAFAAGVKRLVYISSIKVNGEETAEGKIYQESDIPSLQDPYGVSKWEAEQALHQVAQETGLEVVIVRPPLVYGAGVKGNFIQMLKVLSKRLPLPFASIENQRSLVYVENLVDALITCATHPTAAGQTYLVSDGEDVSTPELLRQLGAAMGRPAMLLPFPPKLLMWLAAAVGKSDQVQRITGSLQIDSAKIRRELNWTPPYTLQQGLQATADWYRKANEIKQSAN
ncbi:MAG: SDR family oxidoreductase [Sideroxydans sp.]|nr:SDR family oxidoreductase [Sideroxydans sp.]